jgi:fucose permease
MMCLAIAVNLPPVYLTTFSETFGGETGLTSEQLGRVGGLTFANVVIGILISGVFADHWGAKGVALVGLVMTGAGLCILAVARNYAMVLVACSVMGFGSGVLDMVLSPIVCAVCPDRKASALNWLHAFYCVGAVCTVLIGSAALHFGIPWRAVSGGMLLLPAVLFIGFLRLHVPPLVQHKAGREPVRSLIRHTPFVLALLAIMMAGATEAGMAQWLPAYAETRLGYTKATGAIALAGFSVMMVTGRMLAGSLERHFRPVGLMMLSAAACVVLYLAGCFLPSPFWALAACVGVGLCVSPLWPTTLGVAADRFPRGGASMFAVLAATGNMGCLMAPWLVGVMATRTTLNLGLATAGAFPVLVLLLVAPLAHERPTMGANE